MFCYQCEQTDRRGELPGCASARGVCGKDAPTSDLQDALVHAVLGVAQHTAALRALGATADEDLHFCCEALFTTLTNVNFDPARIELLVREADARRAALAERLLALGGPSAVPATGPALWRPATTLDGLLAQAAALGPDADLAEVGPTVTGLRALVLYGLKGVAAYAHHAHVIGGEDPRALAGVERAAVFLAGAPTDPAALLEEALELGRTNLAVMELLDRTNLARFGARSPAAVPVTPVPGRAVLVSGHDFLDLEAVLEATAGTGINVYTHGELLPAHSYPALARYPHLVGNYGGAWYEQRREFAAFPGPVVMTSNCLVEPRPAYRERLFTTGPVGWPGVRHVTGRDFTDVVAAALAQPGFGPEVAEAEQRTVTVGFGHDVVLAQADAIVAAVRAGELNHFFLIGGCDGSSSGRDYYSSFADATPDDSAILTLGCAKFRFNGHEFGTVAGLPRLLDVGQCNDAYSAIRIATALADAFGCGVNDLPLTLAISWFEQKAVAVLLTLLALDVRTIRLGPQLPAFLTPEAVGLLVTTYGLHTNTDPAADLAADLAGTRG